MPIVKEIGKHNVFFNGVSKGKTPNTVCLKVFRKRQHKTSAGRKRRREDSSLGPPFLQTRSPKTTFSGTSSNCRAVRGGGGGEGGGVATEKPCVFDMSRGGLRGGLSNSPLLGIRHAEQCRRILIIPGARLSIGSASNLFLSAKIHRLTWGRFPLPLLR